ncbi:MAG: phage tail tip lysozyme [Clostridia bacterium]|nr:phage tail tip lysozyme [Clostridia bacterium]
MALRGKDNAEKIWNFFLDEGFSIYGIAALMGNLSAESGLDPKNLQNSCEKRLNYTDAEYTAAVDNGTYKNFTYDGAGYGLPQFTFPSRKEAFYKYAKAAGKSIGDLETQLLFMVEEMKKDFKSVYSALKTASDVKTASDLVLKKYEAPKDQSDAVKRKRAEYGQEYFNRFSGAGEKKGEINMSIMVGSARIDERGNASGGAAGDQKQTSATNDLTGEVSMQKMYSHSKGWYILRPKSAAHAVKMADLMKAACNNANIGYDQGNRLGVVQHGIMTAVKTECDCSSLVREVVKEATGKDPGNFTTANEAASLEATGLFESKRSYVSQSATPVYDGDVLVTKTKGHTVIVVSGNARKAASGSSSAPAPSVSTAKIESAKGFDKTLAGAYKTIGSLYLRAGAGKGKPELVVMPNNTTVRNYGYYTLVDGTKWLYVQTTIKGVTYTGFCSSNTKYLAKQ